MSSISGPQIQLVSGKYFHYLDQTKQPFDINDIAIGLSHICRFTGQCEEFYSDAQHSVLVSKLVPPQFAFEGLMHDAHEFAVGDMNRPLKRILRDYATIEHRIEKALRRNFFLPDEMSPEVKIGDNQALFLERTRLLRNDTSHWSVFDGMPPPPVPACFELQPLDPKPARALFLERYHELAPSWFASAHLRAA